MIGQDFENVRRMEAIINLLESSKMAFTRGELELILGFRIKNQLNKLKSFRIREKFNTPLFQQFQSLYYLDEEQLDNRLDKIYKSLPVEVIKVLENDKQK